MTTKGEKPSRVLFIFQHGLGDCLQFTIVLTHFRKYLPEAYLAVVAKIGRANVFYGLADQCWELRHPFYWRAETWDLTLDLSWNRPSCNYLTAPPTKVTECYYNELCPPLYFPLDPALFRYVMQPQPEAEALAARWLQEKVKGPFAFCHFFSEVSNEDKMLIQAEADCITTNLLDRGLTPLVLDNARRAERRPGCLYIDTTSGLYDRWGSAQVLRSLIARAKCCVTIDSGPGHCAASTETPTLVIWKKTVCLYCFDPAPNVLHLTPDYMPSLMFDDFRDEALDNFERDYNSRSYDDLLDCLPTTLNTLNNAFTKGSQ